MTTNRHLERDLPAILGEIAMGRYPDYIDDVLATTAQRRQRPGWTFLERWLPVELVKSRALVPRLPWRQIGVLAIIAVLLAAMLAAFIGSRQQRLPPAFGVAANGLLAYEQGGDLYTVDPVNGQARAFVTGPEMDLRPVWSLDGTRVVFERKVDGSEFGPGLLFVANQDGSGLVQITPEPLRGLADWGFSPDGRSVAAYASGKGGQAIVVVASNGAGQPQRFDVSATADDMPPLYRLDGSEIMFLRRQLDTTRTIYALDPVSGNVRTVIDPAWPMDIHGASWSPDGTRIAYGLFDQTTAAVSSRTHVVLADGTGDIAVDTDPNSFADAGMTWSNDGTRLIITRLYAGKSETETIARSAVVPIDRSSVGVELECPPGAPAVDCSANWTWSPTIRRCWVPSSALTGRPRSSWPIRRPVVSVPLRGLRPDIRPGSESRDDLNLLRDTDAIPC